MHVYTKNYRHVYSDIIGNTFFPPSILVLFFGDKSINTSIAIMMRFLSSLAIFLTIASASGNRCSLSDPIEIDTNLFLEQRRYDDETFTMRLTYTGGRSWIGIGMIDGGIGKPAAAVIGRSDNVTSVEIRNQYQRRGWLRSCAHGIILSNIDGCHL